MKANEAPERIYISVIPSEFGWNKTITCGKDFPNAIEYTRTDVFIEKACEVLAKIHKNYSTNALGTEYLINDFKKAMEK